MSVGDFFFGDKELPELFANAVNTIRLSAIFVCLAVFLGGAFTYIISAGAEDRKGLGKSMMIGAVIGLAVVVGAQAIMNTILFFVYG
jgi:hypothetical protein